MPRKKPETFDEAIEAPEKLPVEKKVADIVDAVKLEARVITLGNKNRNYRRSLKQLQRAYDRARALLNEQGYANNELEGFNAALRAENIQLKVAIRSTTSPATWWKLNPFAHAVVLFVSVFGLLMLGIFIGRTTR